MPRSSINKRKRSVSASRRRRGKRTRSTTVVRQPQMPFARSQIVKLRYCDRLAIDSDLGIFASHHYRANSCYDPDLTGTGHQPMGFDQYSLLYDHYTVIGSKITVTGVSRTDTETASTGILGVLLADTTNAYTGGITHILEEGRSNWKYLGPADSSNGVVTVSKGFSAKKFFTVANMTDNTTRLGAQTNADPTEDAIFTVFVAPVNAADEMSNLHCMVTIEYIVQFTEPKSLNQS